MGQTLSFAATYELTLQPSLFTYDNKTETDTPINISQEHHDKIAAHVSENRFKSEISQITKVSVNGAEGGVAYLTFDHSKITYNADNNTVTVAGKWNHVTKQNKKSIKRAKHAGGAGGKRALVSVSDDKEDQSKEENGSDNELDIKLSDVIAEIKNKLSQEAYLESEISKQNHLFICFSDDVDMDKV